MAVETKKEVDHYTAVVKIMKVVKTISSDTYNRADVETNRTSEEIASVVLRAPTEGVLITKVQEHLGLMGKD